MLSPEVLQRLELLNRQPLPEVAKRAVVAPPPPPEPVDCSLEALVPGEVIENEVGTHYRVRQPLAELWPAAPKRLLQGERKQNDVQPSSEPVPETSPADGTVTVRRVRRVDPRERDLMLLAEHFPRDAVLIDLETCGFAGSAIFLVGLVRWDADCLVLEHLLARDYREEAAVLASVWQRVAEDRLLVSFNGKSFDWPMVCDRSIMHRLVKPQSGPPPLPHFDLLHHARRRWRKTLPNCKLQTLERAVCRRYRNDDIPGHQIPHEYHAFVRSGDARQLARIIHHNTLDLVTLAELAWRLV